MSLVIANNVGALNARNNLTRASSALNRSIERLSSGFKINRGADGPAALVISEKQRAQIAGLRQAIDNTEKAGAVVQTAEGALNEINSILVKIRSLALDSANSGVNDTDAFAANQAEITNALDTINRISTNTQFGEKALLDGTAGILGTPDDADVTFLKATGDTNAGTYAVAVTTQAQRANVTATAQTSTLANNETLTVNGIAISLNAGLTQDQVVARINEYTSLTGVVAEDLPTGATQTRLRSIEFGADAEITVVSDQAAAVTSSGFGTTLQTVTGTNVAGTIDGVAASGSGAILTATTGAAKGLAVRFAELASDKALSAATGSQGNVAITNNSLVFQIGANQNQTASLAIQSTKSTSLGLGVSGVRFNSLADIDVTSADKAQETLKVIDAAIDELSNIRGTLGAFQTNTLESIAANMRTTLENTINAESVIRDTDFAEEISTFTNNQILVQAGTSVLSSANQTTQSILALLQ